MSYLYILHSMKMVHFKEKQVLHKKQTLITSIKPVLQFRRPWNMPIIHKNTCTKLSTYPNSNCSTVLASQLLRSQLVFFGSPIVYGYFTIILFTGNAVWNFDPPVTKQCNLFWTTPNTNVHCFHVEPPESIHICNL